MPETNSSSSHTLTIYGDDMCTREEVLAIPGLISPDGKTITIPGGNTDDFGRYSQDFNDVISKLQYVTAGIDWHPERKEIIEKVLKDYLGVENVVYDWYNEDEVNKWCDENPGKEFEDCPLIYREDGTRMDGMNEVDHESYDLIDENICESEESLRDFLFSPNSWIFTGEELVTEPWEKFPSLIEEKGGVYFILDPAEKNVDPEGKIGKIEFEILSNFPYTSCAPDIYTPPSWGIKKGKEKPWIGINVPDEERPGQDNNFIHDYGEWNKLTSLWIKRDLTTGKSTMEWGEIPKSDENLKIYVPHITPETFKFPFQLKFVDINTFGEFFNTGKTIYIAGVPDEIVFNLSLESPNLKINEYV